MLETCVKSQSESHGIITVKISLCMKLPRLGLCARVEMWKHLPLMTGLVSGAHLMVALNGEVNAYDLSTYAPFSYIG